MARRSSRRRSSSRSKGRKSYGRRRSSGRTSTTRSGKTLPIVPLAIAAGGAYLLWQHIQAQKALAAGQALQNQIAQNASNAMTSLLPTI